MSPDAYKGIPTVAYIVPLLTTNCPVRIEEGIRGVQEDMESYVKDNGGGWESVIRRLEETHQKYKMVEAQLFNRRQR